MFRKIYGIINEPSQNPWIRAGFSKEKIKIQDFAYTTMRMIISFRQILTLPEKPLEILNYGRLR